MVLESPVSFGLYSLSSKIQFQCSIIEVRQQRTLSVHLWNDGKSKELFSNGPNLGAPLCQPRKFKNETILWLKIQKQSLSYQ